MFLLTILLSSNIAMAQNTPQLDEYTKQECERKSLISNIDNATKKDIYDLCIQYETAKLTYNQNEQAIVRFKDKKCTERSGFLGIGRRTAADVAKCLEDQQKLQEQYNANKAQRENLFKAYTEAQRQFEARRNAANETREAVREMNRNVDKYFDDMKLSIYDLRLRESSMQNDLNNIANAIDNSALGVYMRDRILNLLNSNTMCDAVNQCGAATKTPITVDKLNEIFDSKIKVDIKSMPTPQRRQESEGGGTTR